MIFKLPRIFMSEQRKCTENPQATQPDPTKIMSPAVLDGPFPGRPKKRISASETSCTAASTTPSMRAKTAQAATIRLLSGSVPLARPIRAPFPPRTIPFYLSIP